MSMAGMVRLVMREGIFENVKESWKGGGKVMKGRWNYRRIDRDGKRLEAERNE